MSANVHQILFTILETTFAHGMFLKSIQARWLVRTCMPKMPPSSISVATSPRKNCPLQKYTHKESSLGCTVTVIIQGVKARLSRGLLTFYCSMFDIFQAKV